MQRTIKKKSSLRESACYEHSPYSVFITKSILCFICTSNFSSIDSPFKCTFLQSRRANISSRVSGLKSGESKSKPCDTSAARACAGTNFRLRCGAIESSGKPPKEQKKVSSQDLALRCEEELCQSRHEHAIQGQITSTYRDGRSWRVQVGHVLCPMRGASLEALCSGLAVRRRMGVPLRQ